MSEVRRVYVEKKKPYDLRAMSIMKELKEYLGIVEIELVRELVRYDLENVPDEIYSQLNRTVLMEPPVDIIYENYIPDIDHCHMIGVEYLPGQFDIRADSALQCASLLGAKDDIIIRTATIYLIVGDVSSLQINRIKDYIINPVDSRECGYDIPDTLSLEYVEPDMVEVLNGFVESDNKGLEQLYNSLGLAMTFQDFLHIRKYFESEEHRNPTITEIRVLDTYWSDHCRHTTFSTILTEVEIEEGYYTSPIKTAYECFLDTYSDIKGCNDTEDVSVSLMDMALLGMKKLRREGKLDDMEVSDEINACSVIVPIEVVKSGVKIKEEWLMFFKNETHNHPTEIEPFGGAATCLGGAIRDPLSGRGYVYHAMRITGAGDPTIPISETMPCKLPQKRIVREAARGYSSYGNQIGLATGLVKEIYHPGYIAKRMEIGAVMGAAPRDNVIRQSPRCGDAVVMMGGRTGRDGIGGATGSSVAHDDSSLNSCGAQVQKGNAPTERKLQRLFRRSEVSRLIKKCNDFGAGGVAVAIGELADGLVIDLDAVPKKYAGLDGTELSISESQERMAVVVESDKVDKIIEYANSENIEAIKVAHVTDNNRLIIRWRGVDIVNISRAFLDTNGTAQYATALVEAPIREDNYFNKIALESTQKLLDKGDVEGAWLNTLRDLGVCSQKGLVEMFDSSIGARSVIMPYGGIYQGTKSQVMVATFPVLDGETDVCSVMSYGFDPYISEWSPYHGAVYAITESISKIVASGGDYKKIRFTFQEYFKKLGYEARNWGQPFAALLGAFDAQVGYGLPAIGGKDSMSGSFGDINVPPTLVSFAVSTGDANSIISGEFKEVGSNIALFRIDKDEYSLPIYDKVMDMYDSVSELIRKGIIISAYVVDSYGMAVALTQMSMGNELGVNVDRDMEEALLFENGIGNILAEICEDREEDVNIPYTLVGRVTKSSSYYVNGIKILMDNMKEAYQEPLEGIFPTRSYGNTVTDKGISSIVDTNYYYEYGSVRVAKAKIARPRVFIPVLPGTNCEDDSSRAFEKAGGIVNIGILRNGSQIDIKESIDRFADMIRQSQILMLPGGFSAADEPDGSAKFFATVFRNDIIKEAVSDLLDNRDGLVLGICNGFQTLIKLGLVPYGRIINQDADALTLTFNSINRHIAKMTYHKAISNLSPWLYKASRDVVYVNPSSHGEGRLVGDMQHIQRLFDNGQIATRYCDPRGVVSMEEEWNINGSYQSIEGLTSPDGRCFGKMVHVERIGKNIAKNVYGDQDMRIFESGVDYYR